MHYKTIHLKIHLPIITPLLASLHLALTHQLKEHFHLSRRQAGVIFLMAQMITYLLLIMYFFDLVLERLRLRHGFIEEHRMLTTQFMQRVVRQQE
jgi:fucose permease